MMYRKTTPRFQVSIADLKMHRKILFLICVVLLILSIGLGVLLVQNMGYQRKVAMQFEQRMYSASAAAIDEVSRLNSIVTSNYSARLARVRQYVYYMDQLNTMSISLAGGESGRLVRADFFTTLNEDLDTMDDLLALSTTSTLDARTKLQNHLEELQASLRRQ